MTTSSFVSDSRAISHPLVQLSKERRLTLLALVWLLYFTTCGGAFGLEPLIPAVGAGWATVLILITPLLWSIPIALMVAELSSLMPEEGGYYCWVRQTLGNFWAVQEAWWTMGYSVMLMAIFPVLFVSYLTYFIPELSPAGDAAHPVAGPLLRWMIAAMVTLTGMVVNLRGSREVGRSATVSGTYVVAAFGLMVLAWLRQTPSAGSLMTIVAGDLRAQHKPALLLGLSIIVYNYSGWDNISTYAAEVDQPRRNYPRAIAIAMIVVVLSYLLPVIVGLGVTTDAAIWTTNAGWPVISQMIGGRLLGNLIAAAALVSFWALFNAQLLYVSRLPFVMANDAWLPKFLAKAAPGTAAPKAAIVMLCVITALFTALSYGGLAVIQCVLYTAALSLEFVALIALRLRRRENADGFRVPWNWWGLGYVCVAPFAFAMLVLFATLRDWQSYKSQLSIVAGVAASGIALYFWRRERAREKHETS